MGRVVLNAVEIILYAFRGFYEGDEEKRLTVLKQATELGAPFVDVELKAADAFFKGTGRKNETEIILSYHNYEHTPDMETLRTIIQQLRDSGADIAKISTAVLDIAESRRLMDLLQEQEGKSCDLSFFPQN